MKKHYLRQIDPFSPPIESEGQSFFELEKGQTFEHDDRFLNSSLKNENERKSQKTEEN